MTCRIDLRCLRAAVPALLLLAALLPPAAPAQPPAAPLLTPAQLSARLSEPRLRILDIRAAPDDGTGAYDEGHVPGALPAPYARWRGPADDPGRLPSAEALTALLQALGIDAETRVVVVHAGTDSTDFGAAARVYWTLKASGVKSLSILNGGHAAWVAAGLPLSTERPAVARSAFRATLDPHLIATRDEIARALQSRPAAGAPLLLDARPRDYFFGWERHAAAAAPGTLPGSRNLDSAVWFHPGSGVLDVDAVARVARERGIPPADAPTVSFCNTGHWAATNWFVLSELLGQPDVKLYPASMVEWSRSGLPMDNVPSRLAQFWHQLRTAAGAH